jgi:hypothetical protein
MTPHQNCSCGGRPVPVRFRRRFAGSTFSPRDRTFAWSTAADHMSAPELRGNRPTTVPHVAARISSSNHR